MENLKHTKQYAEKLADTHLVHISDDWSKASFVVGYMRAIEETAAPELLEALDSLFYELTGEQECEEELEKGLGIPLLTKVLIAKAAIKKAKGEQ